MTFVIRCDKGECPAWLSAGDYVADVQERAEAFASYADATARLARLDPHVAGRWRVIARPAR